MTETEDFDTSSEVFYPTVVGGDLSGLGDIFTGGGEVSFSEGGSLRGGWG